jgi:hypothetical protein
LDEDALCLLDLLSADRRGSIAFVFFQLDVPVDEVRKGGGTELAPESDRGSNVFGQGCDGPAPLAGGALVHGQHA